MQVSKENSNRFLFFSYGSNLLTKRISLLDVKAEFVSIARLEVSNLTVQCFVLYHF